MTRDQFLEFARSEITEEYGGVPIGIDEAVERIADVHAAEVERAELKAYWSGRAEGVPAWRLI